MKIINNSKLNFKNNTSPFALFTTKQNINLQLSSERANSALNQTLKQDTIEARAKGKISPSILSYDSHELLNGAIGAFGTLYFPYLLIKKIPQKENWSKFNTNLLKAGIPICAFLLADSLSYISKGKRFFELFKKDKNSK